MMSEKDRDELLEAREATSPEAGDASETQGGAPDPDVAAMGEPSSESPRTEGGAPEQSHEASPRPADAAPSAESAPAGNPAAGSAGAEGAAPAPGGEPREQEPPSVFAPSPWERRKGADPSKKDAAPKDKRAARKEEEEQRRREERDSREARELELKIAKEHRKAQEEARRKEARRKEEEARLRRREEKAEKRTVRRVGTMTLGVSLIAIGAAILMYMLNPNFNLQIVAFLAPVILISLGVEVLIRYFFSKDRTYQYDFASGLICIFLVVGSFFVAIVPELMYYVSPQRFASEEQLVNQEKERLYEAFRGDQRVKDVFVNGSINGYIGQKDENGNWIYALDYLHIDMNLLDGAQSEGEFARTCRELLDKMMESAPQNPANTYITFSAPYNEEGTRYELDINNRLQMEMDVEHLEKLVTPIYSKPTRENGWTPNGYDDLYSDYGAEYAEHFALLLEDFDVEAARTYYGLVYDYGTDAAESYYRAVVEAREEDEPEGGPESQPPTPASSEPEPPTAPEGPDQAAPAGAEAGDPSGGENTAPVQGEGLPTPEAA